MKRTNFINKKKSEQSGITLVALVITIIVLLILAGVTVATLTGDNELLQKAGEAKNTTLEAEGLERIKLAVMASHDENGINTTSLVKNLSQITGLTDTNNQAITENTEITLPKNIKLNNFKYKIKVDGTVIIDNPILPDEYQQVEYIESTGTQYIDTGLLSKNYPDIFVEINGNFTKIANSYIFGAGFHNDYNTNCSWKVIGISKSPFGFVAQNGISGKEQVIMAADKQEHIFILDTVSNIGRIDQNSQVLDNNGVKPINFNYLLFAINNNGIIDRKSSFKMNSCKILENNQLIRYYIPCYRISDNVVGMYDTVEGKFYTNQGSGKFGYETEDGTYVAPTNN